MNTDDWGGDRIVSTNTKVKQVCALKTDDLNNWERGFVASLERMTQGGKDCARLTDPMRDTLDRLWKKHFS